MSSIAVIGSGVSGLVSAWLLSSRHRVTVFEAETRAGGHVLTVPVERAGRVVPVDLGFIVLNDWTYPRFRRLLRALDVPTRPTRMTFGVRDDVTGLEYAASGPAALFAQGHRLLSPAHWSLVSELLRFCRRAARLSAVDPTLTLERWVLGLGHSRALLEAFVIPMAGAIWSADRRALRDFPAAFFLRFFQHHGMLHLVEQPTWRTVVGGSRRYVDALLARLPATVRLGAPARRVLRGADGVTVESAGAAPARFDQVVLATHAPEALALLGDATPAERQVLGAFRTQENEVVLHDDASVLPRSPRARAAWNYRVLEREGPVPVTYDMNRLQGLPGPERYLVTLNQGARIDPRRVLHRTVLRHPVFDHSALAAQARYAEIAGTDRRTHFAGAYWFNGFHEDGVRSAERVARGFGIVGP